MEKRFTKIVIPRAVWDEVIAGGINDIASRQLPTVSWVKRVGVSEVDPKIMAWDLGPGESEVLSFALNNPGYTAMIDDTEARRAAFTLGIPTLGTCGAVILAKRRGVLDHISPAIQLLRDSGLWLSDEFVKLLKQQAGE